MMISVEIKPKVDSAFSADLEAPFLRLVNTLY